MNYKRGRPKNRRAGCLLCKPHKANGADRRTMAEIRQDEADKIARQLGINLQPGDKLVRGPLEWSDA